MAKNRLSFRAYSEIEKAVNEAIHMEFELPSDRSDMYGALCRKLVYAIECESVGDAQDVLGYIADEFGVTFVRKFTKCYQEKKPSVPENNPEISF